MGKVLPIAGQEATEKLLRIGDLAERADKSTRALRLYEEMKLLGPVVRTQGGHRLYSESSLKRLEWIDKLQLLGFSLNQVSSFLVEIESKEQGPEAMKRVRALFSEKLEETKSKIKSLTALSGELEDSLNYLGACSHCDPNTLFSACKACDQAHVVDSPPLVAGIHASNNLEDEL